MGGGQGGSAGGLLQGVCTLPRGCTSRREGQGYYDGFQQKAKEGCGPSPVFLLAAGRVTFSLCSHHVVWDGAGGDCSVGETALSCLVSTYSYPHRILYSVECLYCSPR